VGGKSLDLLALDTREEVIRGELDLGGGGLLPCPFGDSANPIDRLVDQTDRSEDGGGAVSGQR
jgi:hypothetical protein